MWAFSRILRVKAYLPWLGVVFLCSGLTLSLWAGFHNRPPPRATSAATRILRYSFNLQNTTGRCIRKVVFQAAAPLRRTATQQCLDIQSSHHFRLTRDRYGNQILHFDPLDLAPYATRVIAIEAHLLISARPAALDSPVSSTYLAPEKYIECNQPAA